MPIIAIVQLHDLTIVSCYEDSAPNQQKFGGPWGWADHTVHLQVPDGLDHEILCVKKTMNEENQLVYSFEVDSTKQADKIA